jgi:hypothetical protein
VKEDGASGEHMGELHILPKYRDPMARMSSTASFALRVSVVFVILTLLGTSWTRTAAAQAPSASASGSTPPKPVLVGPKLIGSASVDYPTGGTGDATVILALVIAADGTVTSATSFEGPEPFAATAVGAALTWKFHPATQDGTPIKSKIKFKVTFQAPTTVAPSPSTSSSAATPAPSASASAAPSASSSGGAKPPPPGPKALPDAALELFVVGEKLAPMVTSLSKVEVHEMPGAFGDPFRALEAMPGVTPIVSGIPFFYIRGAPPGNVGYFLDGVRVPYLYHVGLGPSVIHPAMVERVDLYPGGYPARFGRYAGGIVSGETTDPRKDFHADANIRIFDAGAMVESGFDNGRGTVLIGGRYSYTAAILSLVAKSQSTPSSEVPSLDYRDYQLRVTYDLTDKDRVTLFGFGSYDLLAQRKNGIENIVFGSEFYRLDTRYEHTFGPNSSIRYALTLGWDQTHVADLQNAIDRMIATRIELRHAFSEAVLLRAGGDFALDAYKTALALYSDPDTPIAQTFEALFPPRKDLAGGVWADVVWRPSKYVEVTPGLRADVFKSGTSSVTALDPRLAMRFKITDKLRIIHAYGLAHQAPSFIVPVPGLTPGTLDNGLQAAFQTAAGIDADFPSNFSGTATVFHNAFYNMTDAIGTATAGLGTSLNNDPRSRGEAYGLEVFLRRKMTERLGGFFTYTLSRSTRTLGGLTYPATFDRTHVANLALGYDLGRRWKFGTRLMFYTGGPKITSQRGLVVPPPTLSPDRDPPFYRLDVRLEKKWILGKTTWLAFVVEMLNATFHKETVQGTEVGPVTIPSIGVEGGL